MFINSMNLRSNLERNKKMIGIGSDHGGYILKEQVKKYLTESNILFKDFGTLDGEMCDYPNISRDVAEQITQGFIDKGLLFCGTGLGVAIVANKIKGIRAVTVTDPYSARYSRLHNDANILSLGGRVIGIGLAIELIDIFLNTDFEGGRHQKRINMIEDF